MEKKDINQLKSEIYRQVELIQDETALQMLQEAAEALQIHSKTLLMN
ncbi:MAG: hypothetical protein IPK31_17295 [Chitinophagaceae bacterium]|nr:hypothetical protein [Chitinophagaceae bacterium]